MRTGGPLLFDDDADLIFLTRNLLQTVSDTAARVVEGGLLTNRSIATAATTGAVVVNKLRYCASVIPCDPAALSANQMSGLCVANKASHFYNITSAGSRIVVGTMAGLTDFRVWVVDGSGNTANIGTGVVWGGTGAPTGEAFVEIVLGAGVNNSYVIVNGTKVALGPGFGIGLPLTFGHSFGKGATGSAQRTSIRPGWWEIST